MTRRVGSVLAALDAGLLALFAAAYAAAYVPPRVLWGLQLVATALPALSLAVAVAAAPVALARRWTLLAVHGAACLLALARFGPGLDNAFRSPGPPPSGTPTLRVMSFNAATSRLITEAAGEDLLALLRREPADLLCLQQSGIRVFPHPPRIRPMRYLRVLFDSLDYRLVWPKTDTLIRLMQPVLSLDAVVLERQTETRLPADPGDEAATRVVRTEFTWQGRRAVVYNLHLRSFGQPKPWRDDPGCWRRPACWGRYLAQYREAFLVRAREADRIKAMLDRETLPLLVCGDFNSTPHHWVYRRLARGLTDVYAAAGTGRRATYSSRVPFIRIDYILAGPAWHVVSAHVAEARLSDHLPLVGALTLRAGARSP